VGPSNGIVDYNREFENTSLFNRLNLLCDITIPDAKLHQLSDRRNETFAGRCINIRKEMTDRQTGTKPLLYACRRVFQRA